MTNEISGVASFHSGSSTGATFSICTTLLFGSVVYQFGCGVTGRPVKRSLTLRGHRTSVSLEDAFWKAFRQIADERGLALNALAAEIDETRGDVGLASAIRVFILNDLQHRASQKE